MFHFLTRIGLSALLLFVSNFVFSQSAPDSIAYQGILRDQNGAVLANQFVTIQFAIRSDSTAGYLVFEEFHELIPTNQFGLFSSLIGGGVNTGLGLYSNLSDIDWRLGVYFLEVSATVPGTGDPQIIGTSQLVTVPFAFFADNAGKAQVADTVLNEADGDPTNEIITGFEVVGTNLIIEEGDASFPVNLLELGLTANANEITDVHVEQDTMLVITELGNSAESYDVSEIAYATWVKTDTILHNNSSRVGINSIAPQSTLDINGSLSLGIEMITTSDVFFMGLDLNQNATIYNADVTNGDITIHLPQASQCAGRIYKFKKKNGNNDGVLNTDSSNLILMDLSSSIEGDDDFTLGGMLRMEFATLVSNGAMWYVVDYSSIY